MLSQYLRMIGGLGARWAMSALVATDERQEIWKPMTW
jgi:hypothetical protein